MKLKCLEYYRCGEFTARPGDIFVVGESGPFSMTKEKAKQVLRDFPDYWEKIEDEEVGDMRLQRGRKLTR